MVELKTHSVRLPLRSPFEGVEYRYALLVEGAGAWGECSPFPAYPCSLSKARLAAEEAALSDWPAPVRDRVEVNAFVPRVPPGEAGLRAAAAAKQGFRCVKVKVGSGDDVGRVSAVRAALGPHASIRVDANGAWDVGTAVAMLDRLGRFDLELVEEPVHGIENLARVRRLSGLPIAADESVRCLHEARHLARIGAADAVVLKVQPLGGVRAALAVAEAAGVPAVVTSMLETSVGLAAGLALALALPELPYACGLGTASLFAEDVTRHPLLPVDGTLVATTVTPDPRLVSRYRVG